MPATDTWGKLVAVATPGILVGLINTKAKREVGAPSAAWCGLPTSDYASSSSSPCRRENHLPETPAGSELAEINTATDVLSCNIPSRNSTTWSIPHQMLDLWLAGDERTRQTRRRWFKDNNKLRKRMLEDRAQHWFDELHHANESGLSVLAVVGTGHLVGDNSLLNPSTTTDIR